MAEQEKIKLTDLLGECLEFKREPSEKQDLVVMALINRFIVKEYIPLGEKIAKIALILGGLNSEGLDQFEVETQLTIGKIVYGVLSYVDNLENDLDRLSMSASVVDLLYEMGVIDAILEHCSKDYARLDKMVDETVNFSNLFKLVETTSLYSSDSIDEFVKEISSFKTELTPEMLKDLKSIANSAAPEFSALKETLVDDALDKVMDVDFNTLKEQPAEVEKEKPEEEPEKEKGDA